MAIVKKKKSKIHVFDLINGLIMVLLSVVCIYPLYYVLMASFSNPTDLMAHQGLLLYPLGGGTLGGYEMVLQNPNIATGYFNTLIYVTGNTVLSLILTVLAAFVVSRKKWMWCRPMTFMITLHMFVGGGLIPFYMLVNDLGMINTRWALIIPGALSVWNMIVLRTAMEGVPESLLEAAQIDGANDLVVLCKVVIPVIMPAIAVQVLFYAVASWNAWFNASIFIDDRQLMPLQLIMREILLSNDTQSLQGMNSTALLDRANYMQLTKYCVVIVSTLPILVAYPFVQKYFVKGIMVGSVKG